MESRKPLLVIGGGVGPMAGVELQRSVIEETLTDGTDQDHLDLIHLSLPRLIRDRTEYLIDSSSDNPGPAMAHLIIGSISPFTDYAPVIGVPCNTFHSASVFTPFREQIERQRSGARIIHMLQQTVIHIDNTIPSAERIGILTTTGTRKSGVWRGLLEDRGFAVIQVPESMQEELHASIYDRKYGLKAASPASDKAKENFAAYARILKDKGADLIILGCTEIPFAFPSDCFEGLPLINPIRALARGMISAAAAGKLKPASAEGK